ncbi:hypothetical protein CQ12_13840 [Bradyrhizobium jicamae]|uniref:Uncharacterized protein n=1 Tax=Bradyrhizobium jicamae TaxID=280332 RepID=A0A0R3LP27_9BRAD|nr:hypothetical protein [Bradyrhizobium jicamae]KRR09564.1 hypothetical protein CQ12_13840 [Bradyrhizobium jicamae]
MADPDWFARAASGIALLISGATFIWTRVDKHRERKAAERAGLPSITLRWNPAADHQGWYSLKLTFRNITQSVRIDRVSLMRPRRSLIATWGGGTPPVRGLSGKMIEPKWEFHAAPNPVHGEAAATTHLQLKTTEDHAGAKVKIKLEGRYLHGAMTPFEMTVASQRD